MHRTNFAALLATAMFMLAATAEGAESPARRVVVRTTIYEVGRAPVPTTADCDASEPRGFLDGWGHGGEYDRAPAINTVRALRDTGDIKLVEDGSGCLRRYYSLRAGRQQSILDIGSGVVFIGGVGALVSGRAGDATQRDWAYAAVLPVVLAQFNASQPTRDLYAGGKIGLAVVGARYRELDGFTQRLTEAMGVTDVTQTQPDSPFKAACDRLRNNSIEGWAAGEDKVSLLADYRKLKQACVMAAAADANLFAAWRAANGWRSAYAYAYSTDLLRLDDEILSKDRQLRYSPVQTLSAMAAAPFSAAATLLSSENGGQAVDRLKTQQTFSNMDVPLSPVILPPCPQPLAEDLQLGEAALIRRTVTTERLAGQPKPQDVIAALDRMQEVADALNSARGGMNQRIKLASIVTTLASYDRLAFSYDANTQRISVALAPTVALQTQSAALSPAAGR